MCAVTEDLLSLFKETDGYSGSDIRLVCKEAAMRPVRKIFDALENHSEGKTYAAFLKIHKPTAPALQFPPTRRTDPGQSSISTGHCGMPFIELETVTTADFQEVIAHTKPSARKLTDRFSAWEREYESV